MKDLGEIRNDVVGSLLRPAELKQARQRYDEGKLSREDLRQVEDRMIRNAVRLQEELGLAVVTDGEYRRLNFQDSFGESVSGYDVGKASLKFYEQRVEGSNPLQRWGIPVRGEEKGTAGFTKTTGCRTTSFGAQYTLGGVSLCQPGDRETCESDSHWAGSNLPEVRLAEFENRIFEYGQFHGRCRPGTKRNDSCARRGGLSLR